MQLVPSRSRRLVLLAVGLVAPEILAGAQIARADTTPSVTWAASASRPLSDPDWLPVRNVVAVR